MLASSKAGKIPHISDITPEVDLNETTRRVRSAKEMMPYNKLLTNLASSNRTGEYWPSAVFVLTSLRSVRTVTTSGQYSPLRLSRSFSKTLLLLLLLLLILLILFLWLQVAWSRQVECTWYERENFLEMPLKVGYGCFFLWENNWVYEWPENILCMRKARCLVLILT